VVARINGKLDTLTGMLEWKLRSLDPVTLDDIEDPDIVIANAKRTLNRALIPTPARR